MVGSEVKKTEVLMENFRRAIGLRIKKNKEVYEGEVTELSPEEMESVTDGYGCKQDFCVADANSPVLVNGLVCKDPKVVTENDFFTSGLNVAGDTSSNKVGSNVTTVNVARIPGLNTLGISLVRIDFAPWGINAPHTHPRATEILTVIKGTLRVGFVTSNPDNRHITKVLYEGDVFVFPEGLIHYQQNIGHDNAVVIAALSSQNPGVITIANAVFGANPDISADILAKAFQLNKNIVQELQARF